MTTDLEKELDEMTKALEEPSGAGTEAPGTESSGTESPSTESPSTETSGTESPGTEVSGTEAPSTEAPGTEIPETESERKLREENESLRAKLAEKEAPKTEVPGTEAPSTEAPIDEIDFLGDKDLDDLTGDPKAFNQLLNDVFKKGISLARGEQKSGNEFVIKSIPDIVKNTVAIQAQLKKASDKFYEDNEDLKPFKKVVGAVFEELVSENPNGSYEEILKKVEPEVRNRLDLHRKAAKKDEKTPPKLPKKKGGKRQSTKPDLTGLEKEMDEMDSALGLD